MVVSSSETDEGLLEVHSQVDIVETSVSMTTPHSEEARVQALSEEMKAQHLKWLKKLLALLQTDLSQRFPETVQQVQAQSTSFKK